ncbi:MAG: glycoside hydrolase family 1 protein [Candidatus Omnitrophota bacterium]|nr:MAG: glycoside hydrolase family 1 protein [Candidatus Omnitrophota bacterium]
MQLKFPSHFLWGAAISSYQCEGENYNSDWCLWEKERALERAETACNHYHLFEEDFQLARRLNLNSLRISIEWARVCPQKSVISDEEITHYSAVVDTLCKFNLTPFITLHHFTNPIWFSARGGWASSENIDSFLNYLQKIVGALKDKVNYWLIFNEPLVYIYNSFICGIWPPGGRSLKTALRVFKNIIAAYITGYQEIKRIYKDSEVIPQISLAKNMRLFSPCPKYNLGLNNFSSFIRDKIFNYPVYDYLSKKKYLDYLAINYYCKEYVRFSLPLGEECNHSFHKEHRNYLGWYIYPYGFYEILKKLKKYSLPVIITENGTAETRDCFYQDYLVSHLKSLAQALEEGLDIKGYLWWSLLDNFEWDKGFGPRFGLIEVDYNTLRRKIKPFAYIYAKICKENRLY